VAARGTSPIHASAVTAAAETVVDRGRRATVWRLAERFSHSDKK